MDARPEFLAKVRTGEAAWTAKTSDADRGRLRRDRVDRCSFELVEGEYILCQVVNTGDGIAPEDLPKLFHRFSQLDTSNVRKTGGTGFGLSIADAFVEAHGGTLGAMSQLRVGSTFFGFTLPLSPNNRLGKGKDDRGVPALPALAMGRTE